MRFKWLDVLLLVYGALLVALGAYGYFAKGSVMSFVAGGALGVLAIFFAALTPSKPRVGRIGASVVTVLALAQSVPTALSKQTWNSITLASTSAVVLLCLVGGHFAAMRARRAGA